MIIENNNYFDDKKKDEFVVLSTLPSGEKIESSLLCVVCNVGLKNIKEYVFKCPKCKNEYNLDSEIVEHEDYFQSSHYDEPEGTGVGGSGPLFFTANDEEETSETKPGFESMDYIHKKPGIKVLDYQERKGSEQQ